MWQNIIVIALVVLAGAWLVRRTFFKRGSGCGCSCSGSESCCGGSKHFTSLDGRGCDGKC